jgi:hypothetical protein
MTWEIVGGGGMGEGGGGIWRAGWGGVEGRVGGRNLGLFLARISWTVSWGVGQLWG